MSGANGTISKTHLSELLSYAPHRGSLRYLDRASWQSPMGRAPSVYRDTNGARARFASQCSSAPRLSGLISDRRATFGLHLPRDSGPTDDTQRGVSPT